MSPVVIFVGLLTCVFCALSDAAGSNFTLEFENAAERESQHFRAMWRSMASRKRTLLMYEGDYVVLDFCLSSMTSVTINNLRFSNDGSSDNITFLVDGQQVGSFETFAISDWGRMWNVFQDTGVIGRPVIIHPGNHELNISVTVSDNYGVEFDSLQFELDNEISEETFLCQTELKEHVMFSGLHSPPVLYIDHVKPNAIQRSFPSDCIDETNVQICFNATSWIGAQLFAASEFLNNTGLGDEWENAVFNAKTCNEYEGNVWKVGIEDHRNSEFGGAEFGSKVFKISLPKVLENLAVIPGDINDASGSAVEISFQFEQNVVDTFPWVILTVGLVEPDNVPMAVSYFDFRENRMSIEDAKMFTYDFRKHTWFIPTQAFSSEEDNTIRITFAGANTPVLFDFLRLDAEERSKNESSMHIFENKFMKIRGVKNVLGDHSGMDVSAVDESATVNVDRFSIMARKGRRAKFAKIITLHYDGRIFLHTLAERRFFLDLFPKVVSEASGFSLRPRHTTPDDRPVSIADVVIDPVGLAMNVTYTDGSHIMFRFSLVGDETKLVIYDIGLSPDTDEETFGCYFSKAHTNDMAAVDDLTIDGHQRFKILDPNISGKTGSTFVFDHEFAPWYIGIGSDMAVRF